MNFEKISTPSLKDVFVKKLLEKILSGELSQGERLPSEREMAEQMGISRSLVNQGIMELESQGFLSIIPRKGTFVCDYRKHPTPQTLAAVMSYGSIELEKSLFTDLMATRALLEKECAKLACTNIYESTIREMQDILERLTERSDIFVDNLFKFHYLLTQASGNVVYSMIYKGFEPVLRCLMSEHYKTKDDVEESIMLHQKLLYAIKDKNEELSQQYIIDVLNQGVNALEKDIYK